VKALKIGTRGSDLALVQTKILQESLAVGHPNLVVEVHVIHTQGDLRLDAPLGSASPLDKGAFTKELEAALLRQEIDVAVHSLKDLPTENTAGLTLAAILARGPVEDVLISKCSGGIDALPLGARIATGSARREAQALKQRPDLIVEGIRGNVPTRIRKLAQTEGLAAIILAAAGLERLDLPQTLCKELGLHTHVLEDFLPAPGQGAIAVQAREADLQTCRLLTSIHDPVTAECVQAERLLLEKLGGGCHLALGARAKKMQNQIHLKAVWFEGAKCRSAETMASNAQEAATLVFSMLKDSIAPF
jgi:hydroxymethylbilane synthase